jgi:YD repeat-containing protein
VTTLTYDGSVRLSTITDPAGRVTTVVIDANNNLTRITDPDGAVTQYGYANPSNHLITTETNPDNHTATAHYNCFGELTSETLFDGTSTTQVVSAQSGQAQYLLAPGGAADGVSLAYTASVTDPNGHITTLAFDRLSHVVTETDPTYAGTVITYDRHEFPATVTTPPTAADPRGMTTTYTYDDNGNVTSITRPDGSNPGGGTVTETLTYDDPYGIPTTVTDFNGHTTTYTLDPHGNVLRRTDPDGLHEDYTYNFAGQVLTDTDRNGHRTTYTYDSRGRLTRVDNPSGADPVAVSVGGTATASLDNAQNGEGVAQAFDQNPATKWLAAATTAWLQYQFANGAAYTVTQYQMTSGADTGTYTGRAPKNWQLLGSNDGSNWAVLDTQTNQADTASSDTQTYDVASPGSYKYYRLNITANNGDPTYTQLADLTLLAPISPVTLPSFRTYGYDPAGDLTSVTDELGHTSHYTYDPMGRVLTAQDPVQAAAGTNTAYTYDPAGNLLSATDALSHVTTYSYNARNELVGMTDPANQGTGRQYTYAYDPAGNLKSVTDPNNHTTTYTYDPDNRLQTVTDPNSHRTTYAYDLAGELTGVTDPNNHTTAYGYDSDGRLQTVTDANTHTTTYAYDSNDNLTSVTDPNGHKTSYAYDNLNRQISVTDPDGPTTAYGYDAAGNLTSLTDPDQKTTTWTYDALDRPTTETDPLNHTTTYVYDLAGDLIQKTDRNGRVTQYVYDADGRPTNETWVNPQGGSPLDVFSTVYDVAGRVTSVADANGAYAYTYDADNRLTWVNNAAPSAGAPVVGDAGFETPNVGSGTFGAFQYAPAGTPWTFTGGAGISGNGSGFTSGNPNAPEGAQVGFLQGTNSFSQTVSGWAAGTTPVNMQT